MTRIVLSHPVKSALVAGDSREHNEMKPLKACFVPQEMASDVVRTLHDCDEGHGK
jgi:hypothetical protein